MVYAKRAGNRVCGSRPKRHVDTCLGSTARTHALFCLSRTSDIFYVQDRPPMLPCVCEKSGRGNIMPIETLDHYSVRTSDVEKTRSFYESVIGLRSGPRSEERRVGK